MKAVIIYMSNHGTTEKVVQRLDSIFGYNKCKIVDLNTDPLPNLEDFNTIIIGGSVYQGLIQKKLREFCTSHLKMLLTKKIGLFMCYMDEEHQIEEFENSFPQELRDHSVANGYFGGELIFEKMNFFEKAYVMTVKGQKKTISRINSQAINHFAIQVMG